MTCFSPAGWGVDTERKEWTVTEVKTERGESETYRWQSLWPSGGLPEQQMINKREIARERQWQREKEISVVPLPTALETIYLVTVTRVLIINSSCEYSFTHTHSTQHAETLPRTHTQHTHSQSVYLFCDFGGLLALRSLWGLQEIKWTYKKSSNLIFLMHKWIISVNQNRFQDVLMEISLTTHGITHL